MLELAGDLALEAEDAEALEAPGGPDKCMGRCVVL